MSCCSASCRAAAVVASRCIQGTHGRSCYRPSLTWERSVFQLPRPRGALFTATMTRPHLRYLGAFAALFVVPITIAADPASERTVDLNEYGPTPDLPAPAKSILPTVHLAKAEPWTGATGPTAAAGLRVGALARGLQHPRWLYTLPNGDVLVAESEAPKKPEDSKSLSGKVHKLAMKRAGSGAAPSADRITLLRVIANGQPAEKHVLLAQLHSPIGMALVGDTLYVANTDALVSVPYHTGDTEIRATPQILTALPGGPINHHWTKSLIASPDGRYLYVGVGSNSNAGENGPDAEAERAAVWQIDRATGGHTIYASGLRNPVGLAWEPRTDVLWVSVNERDELGDHLPPDYMTALHPGAFYGFPFSYYGQHVDVRVKPQNPERVAAALVPDYALGAHTASLGLLWSGDTRLPGFSQGMFVGQHGSWNRKALSGYKVIFVPFGADGKPSGPPRDVLTGFLSDRVAHGRPVGLTLDHEGALLVADDVGNAVWRVTAAP
jgi:glucose/arabinose dehydrogenase